MRANDEGNFLGAETFRFFGRSVFNLRYEVAVKVNEDMLTITLCAHAGFYGRLTPLVVDLPRSQDPLDIVVLPNNSPGENFAVPSGLSCVANVRGSYYCHTDAHCFHLPVAKFSCYGTAAPKCG